MFIGSSVAQYELFMRCMHFNTIRIQAYIWFYQFVLQSETRLVKKVISKSSIFSTPSWVSIRNPYACLHILFFECKFHDYRIIFLNFHVSVLKFHIICHSNWAFKWKWRKMGHGFLDPQKFRRKVCTLNGI